MKKTILALSLMLAATGVASAATIVPVNVDPAGAGLNDTTARAPEGRNPGTTVGEQRRIVYQFAADTWGAVLNSDVEIRVEASFQPLTCTATSGVLGSAGANTIFSDFPNAPLPGTWYHSALADSIAGAELDETNDVDIVSRFNANLGGTNADGSPCLTGGGWYYGVDGNTPTGLTNFLDVVMHEIGHGLGFQGFSNSATGALFQGTPDVYGANVFDNVSGLAFNSMTNAQRQAAIIGGGIVWTGNRVTTAIPAALSPLVRLRTTGTLVAEYDYGTASFGPVATTTNFIGSAVLATDGTANGSQACNALTNGAAVAGKIAVVDRGTCAFAVKTKNAQNAGAIGVIAVNNAAGPAPGLGGADNTVTIPTISLSQADGNLLKAALPGVNTSLAVVPNRFAGADTAGRALLFSPNPVQGGSSFSHYDISAFPNALMEPAINADLDGNLRLDLSPALYADEGWVLNAGNAKTRGGRCDTGLKILTSSARPGLVGGANLQAADNLCRTSNPTNTNAYKSCIAPFVTSLQTAGVISAGPNSRLNICLK